MLDLADERVLVTGDAGFLGSWLICRLGADGCRAITVPRSRDVDLRQEAAVRRPVPFRESALWDGYPEESNAPYGIAKKMLRVQGQVYREQYGLNAIFLLP